MGLHSWGACLMENYPGFGERLSLLASGHGLTRREWVRRMLAGAGAGIAVPSVAAARSARVRLGMVTPSAAVAGETAAGDWKPAFFSDDQNQTLIALAERIVPGSTGAQVNRFLDTALNAETQEVQQKFVTSLNALEGESLHRYTKSFKDLTADQQDEVLTLASTTSPSDATFAGGKAVESQPGARGSAPNLRDFFDYLKGWISVAYYSSEIGMKELGWTGENFFESFPGCGHAGSHS
jgi:hypothetical protein